MEEKEIKSWKRIIKRCKKEPWMGWSPCSKLFLSCIVLGCKCINMYCIVMSVLHLFLYCDVCVAFILYCNGNVLYSLYCDDCVLMCIVCESICFVLQCWCIRLFLSFDIGCCYRVFCNSNLFSLIITLIFRIRIL